jgi:hypothetical protein
MAQIWTDLIKDARMEVALDVVLAKLVGAVYTEQAQLAVGLERSYLFFDMMGHMLNHVYIAGRRRLFLAVCVVKGLKSYNTILVLSHGCLSSSLVLVDGFSLGHAY